jgi:predicted membrane-bound mannosyltransferase
MLETRIEELTAAVRELTAVLAAHPVAAHPVAANPVVVKEPKGKKPQVKEDPIAEQTSAPDSQSASTPTTDTSQPSESESAPVTYDDVKKATNALSAAKGRDVTIDALSRFGVKRATELDEGQWADYIAYTEKVIGEEA